MNITNLILQAAHAHEETESWWDEYLSLLVDPAHILFELTISIIFDLVVVFLIWRVIIKKIIIPRLRREIHREIDAEHGIDHDHNHNEPETNLGPPEGDPKSNSNL